MKELVELFKTEITGEESKKIQISDEFYIAKFKSFNDNIVYMLYDDLSGSSFEIFSGKTDPFSNMKEYNENMKSFKEFFDSAFDKAFEARKNDELSKIRF